MFRDFRWERGGAGPQTILPCSLACEKGRKMTVKFICTHLEALYEEKISFSSPFLNTPHNF